jgi:hypothetical protein
MLRARRNNMTTNKTNPWDGGVQNSHPRVLPRVVKGDQKRHHGITYSVQKFLKTAYVMPPTPAARAA